jgi:hypothetical protein
MSNCFARLKKIPRKFDLLPLVQKKYRKIIMQPHEEYFDFENEAPLLLK